MPSRVTVYDKNGVAFAELSTSTTRSWVLDSNGQMQFSLASLSDPNCTRSTLQYGNLILVEHLPTLDSSGNTRGTLPSWLGIILPPQEWDFGILTVTAFSIESLLKYRPMPFVTVSGNSGSVFQQIIANANQTGGLPIQLGSIFIGQDNFVVDLRGSAYDEVTTLSQNASMDWDITWQIDTSRHINLYANWYQQKGQVVNQVLSEGVKGNMKFPKLTEQTDATGLYANRVIGYSAATSQGTRLSVVADNITSQSLSNILAISNIFNVVDQAGLNNSVKSLLNSIAFPTVTLELTALDEGKTFSYLSPGAILEVVLKSVGFYGNGIGFQGSVRIMVMEYDDYQNEVALVTEVLSSNNLRTDYA